MVNAFSICLFYDLYRVIAIDIEEILNCDPESGDADNCYLYSYAYRQKHFEYLKSFLQFITTLQFYKFLYDFKVKFNLFHSIAAMFIRHVAEFGNKNAHFKYFSFLKSVFLKIHFGFQLLELDLAC